MSAASSVASKSAALTRVAGVIAPRPLSVALTLTALITALRLTGTVDSDVAWQLWIAERIHSGANLYRDIIETNPPLWFWMALPVDRMATLLHVRIDAVLVVSIGSVVMLSLTLTDRLIDHIAPSRRALLLGYAALLLTAMPWLHVGQREQIALISAVPYAALIAARRERAKVSPLLATLIGVGAGLGFALKHYFLVVPVFLELWLLVCTRRDWRPFRRETLAMAGVGLAYAATVLLIEPDFFTTILPLLRLAYGDVGAPSLRYLFGPLALVGFVTLATVATHWRSLQAAPFAASLFIAAMGFAAAYAIQLKGWTYHAIPLVGCASLALAALLVQSRAGMRALRVVGPALLILPLSLAANDALHPDAPSTELRAAVAGVRPDDAVGFLSTETALPWSITLQRGYRYASRYNGFWMLPAIARNEQLDSPDPRLEQLGRSVVAETVVDFTCTSPKRIVVWRGNGSTSDILPFFVRDRRFAALLSHYRVRSGTSIESYELVSPLPPPASPCRKGI